MLDKIRQFFDNLKQRMNAKARRNLFTEFWSDVYDDRFRIYKVNFFRGVFFGLGSAVGATLIVAGLVAVLGWLVDLPGIGEVSEYMRSSIESAQ